MLTLTPVAFASTGHVARNGERLAHQILLLTRQAAVLERGRIAYHGSSAALSAEPELLDRLLGVAAH